jgi:carboxymethylenebutenolidase
MIIKDTEYVEVPTAKGPMRVHIFRPAAPGKYPGIVLYSEIFQITAPIHRSCAFLAGHGYVGGGP